MCILHTISTCIQYMYIYHIYSMCVLISHTAGGRDTSEVDESSSTEMLLNPCKPCVPRATQRAAAPLLQQQNTDSQAQTEAAAAAEQQEHRRKKQEQAQTQAQKQAAVAAAAEQQEQARKRQEQEREGGRI